MTDTTATTPSFDREASACGVVHMSVGGFHRSHQALYFHQFLADHGGNWMIHGVGLLDSDKSLVQTMNDQDCVYTLMERSGNIDTIRRIESIKQMTHAPTNRQIVIDAISSPETKIVSLTVTEKGYCYNQNGDLDLDHPSIRHDLTSKSPQSALGFLFHGLNQRKRRGGDAVTVLSCDNLPSNGDLTKRLLRQFTAQADPELLPWIENNVSFPNSMVDRITPAITAQTAELVAEQTNTYDPCSVISESFRQWIIEDNFIAGRPALENYGVQFVDDVEAFEQMKVWLLNGSHSALSYISYLLGYRQVDAAISDSFVRAFVRHYMDLDITPVLPSTAGVDIERYKDILIERFSNPAISDQIQRLAMDGSEKIRNAIVPPLVRQLSSHGEIRHISFALAAWYRYLRGTDLQGQPIDIVDPMAAQLTEVARAHPMDARAFLSLEEIFSGLGQEPELVSLVNAALHLLESEGAAKALATILAVN